MTTKEIAEQLYPTTPRGNELPNTIELQRYVYVQKAKQAAYLACATKYISEIEARDKKIEELTKKPDEYILCAAIWYQEGVAYGHQPKNISSGYVWVGRRHHNIINLRAKLIDEPTRRETSVQGFITNLDRFVDRIEANKIAIAANQVVGNVEGDELISEDLY